MNMLSFFYTSGKTKQNKETRQFLKYLEKKLQELKAMPLTNQISFHLI